MCRLTTDQFVKRALTIHDGKYSYDSVVYVNTNTKVCITCPIHGDFWQTPNNHLYNKRGCPECGKIIISMVMDARNVKNNVYQLHNLVIKNTLLKMQY